MFSFFCCCTISLCLVVLWFFRKNSIFFFYFENFENFFQNFCKCVVCFGLCRSEIVCHCTKYSINTCTFFGSGLRVYPILFAGNSSQLLDDGPRFLYGKMPNTKCKMHLRRNVITWRQMTQNILDAISVSVQKYFRLSTPKQTKSLTNFTSPLAIHIHTNTTHSTLFVLIISGRKKTYITKCVTVKSSQFCINRNSCDFAQMK